MANKEFNLSVLENVTVFNTPLKECSEYEAIFSLIKEEIDIVQTEDEMEYQKGAKSPSKGIKRKELESCNTESVFKSPYRKKNCMKVKSSGALLYAQRPKSLVMQQNYARENRSRSLGRSKPGRSFLINNRRHRSSISHSGLSTFSDYRDNLTKETPNEFLEKNARAQITENNDAQYTVLLNDDEDIAESYADDETSRSSKGESTSLATTDPLDGGTANESFVESSQGTTTSSELRQKLTLRRSATIINPENIIKDDLLKSPVESEEENQNFSLTLSPDSKSGAPAIVKEGSLSPSRPRNRKAVCRVSPLKGLTQELESCIHNNDYVENCDSETESMSFTFETIQLLNEYEDTNQHVNNKILDKILSSPTNKPEEQTSTITNNVVTSEQHSVEDPLHIDHTHANGNVPPSTSKRKKSTTKKPKLSKRKSTVTKTPKRDEKGSSEVQPNEDSSHIDGTDKNDDILPSTSKRKRSTTKTPTRSNRKSTEVDPTSSTNTKRFSTRLKMKEPVNMYLSDCESNNSLSVEAAELAEKVNAAQMKSALPTKTLNKLHDLNVQLRHEVLPQHEIENHAGSTALSYSQQKMFLEYAPLNKGTYSPAEDKIIKENWNDFCADHDWDPNDYKPFLRLNHGKGLIMSSLEERRKFVQFLANGLVNRPLCSVYGRFRRLYNKYIALGSRYTEEEDANIIAYMKCHSIETQEKKCAELAKVMDRSRTSIWKRYTKLVSKKCPIEKKKRVLTKVEWDLPLVGEFITVLLNVSLSEELIDLKDAFFPRVFWLKMEEKMKIHYDVMQRFWDRQLHLQLFAPEPISINEIKIKLIEYMHMEKVKNSKEIQWDIIVKYFDGYTIPFLRYVFNHLTMQASVTLENRGFNEIVQWLHNKKINELRFSLNDRILPRISYMDKKATIVEEDLARVRLVSEKSDDN